MAVGTVNTAAFAGVALLGLTPAPAAAQDAGAAVKPAAYARQQVQRTIKRLHGTSAHALWTRGGKAPVPGAKGYGAYAAILYAPEEPERTEERMVEAVVVLPSRMVARPEDILPPEGTELAAVIGAALMEKLEAGDENRIAAAARGAANGIPAEEGVPNPAVWTSRKGGAPTLHLAWPACALAPCEKGVTEVTVPATWIEESVN